MAGRTNSRTRFTTCLERGVNLINSTKRPQTFRKQNKLTYESQTTWKDIQGETETLTNFFSIILLRSSRASERRRIIIVPQRFIVCLLFKHKYWPRLHVTASPCSVLQATRKRTQLLSVPRPLSSFNS